MDIVAVNKHDDYILEYGLLYQISVTKYHSGYIVFFFAIKNIYIYIIHEHVPRKLHSLK